MTAIPTTSIEDLSQVGNVPIEYRHEWRLSTPQEPIVVPGSVFKWYHVHRDRVAVREDVDAAARMVILDEAPGWILEYGLNFALLHQSTAGAFLIVGVWRGHQELWRRIYAVDLAGPIEFALVEGEDGLEPLSCVWELGVVCHERMAWHRYLFSERRDADKRTWLADRYAGTV